MMEPLTKAANMLSVILPISWMSITGCTDPCESPLPSGSNLIQHFQRLEEEQCLHRDDIVTLEEGMNEQYRQTTLHCDEIWRVSSIDGKNFDGKREKILDSASVPDVWIMPNGAHVIAYNDLTINGRRGGSSNLIDTALSDPQAFWRMGLVGYGGIGISIDHMNNEPLQHIKTDLHLKSPQEVVDPDIGMTSDNRWRLTWFGVNPNQMNAEVMGPIGSSKPHYFYRSESHRLEDFGKPKVILKSSHGQTGGADPAILNLGDRREALFIGPLDVTVMAWESENGTDWDVSAEPDFNTKAPLASPDAVAVPGGGYRLYGMKNGTPGTFLMYESKDGKRWSPHDSPVFEDENAFNTSVGVDFTGIWWLYYNMTNTECTKKWGSRRILPNQEQGAPVLPKAPGI